MSYTVHHPRTCGPLMNSGRVIYFRNFEAAEMNTFSGGVIITWACGFPIEAIVTDKDGHET